MSILGMFDIGRTALFTTRKALDTTAHNIANASTPGYSRQDVVLENIPSGEVSSVGGAGRGVQLKEVKRMYDSFINLQVKTEKSNLAYWESFDKSATKIENIFNESSDSGISPAITDFFNAWQEVSQNPGSYAERSLLLNKSAYLTSRISSAYASIDSERTELLKGSQDLANEVNLITASIASLNDKLSSAPGSLDMIDQRDNYIERLNQIVKVTTFEDNNGGATILLNGTPLVDASKSYQMSISTDTDNNMHFYVSLSGADRDVTSYLSGGELKANLDYRDTNIPDIKNKLNEFAFNLSETVNYYHKQGYGLDGSTGNDFFRSLFSVEDPVSGAALSSVDVTDTTKLDYNMQYKIDYIGSTAYNLSSTEKADYQQEGASSGIYWRVMSSTDGTSWTVVNPSSVTLTPSTTPGFQSRDLSVNGLNFRIDGYQGDLTKYITNNNAGETFTVMANPNAARDMALAISDTNKIAASVDSFTVDASNNEVVFNIGGSNMTVTLDPGLYAVDGLAKALQTKMQDAVQTKYGFSTVFPVTYDPGSKKFNIANNSSINASQGVASPTVAIGGTSFKVSGMTQAIDTSGGMTLVGLKDAINGQNAGVTATIYNDGTPTNPYRLILTSNLGSPITITTNDTPLDFTTEQIEAAYSYPANTYAGTAASGGAYTGTLSKTFLVQIVADGAPAAGTAQYKYSTDGGVTWKGSGGSAYDGTNGVAVKADGVLQNIDGMTDPLTTTEGVQIQFTGGALNAGATDDTSDRFSIDVFNPDLKPQLLWTDTNTTAEKLFGFTADSSGISTGGSVTSDTAISAEASDGLTGDNRNAKLIADLINQAIISGKTPTDFYRGIVSDVGVQAMSAKQNLTSQSAMVTELENRRQQVSGVSLDEEAANLIMYQKSFEAAAKMISVADELFTTLLGMLAR